MSKRFMFNAQEPDRLPTHRPFGLFITRQVDKKMKKRAPSEEAPLSKDPYLNSSQLTRFEQVVLPHLDSAYNLARWLIGNNHDAEDVVQDAYLRAVKFFDGFRGGDARPWLLTVVRHACFDWLQRNRSHQTLAVFDEELHSGQGDSLDPAQLALRVENQEMLRQALSELPVEFREVLVLRELEGLSYKEIGAVTNLPPGTIMSRLARARERLRQSLIQHLREGGLT
jgi:RNA polymerase sigma-70 factor, ECF subfamily